MPCDCDCDDDVAHDVTHQSHNVAAAAADDDADDCRLLLSQHVTTTAVQQLYSCRSAVICRHIANHRHVSSDTSN